MKISISRRDFIKMGGVCAAALPLSRLLAGPQAGAAPAAAAQPRARAVIQIFLAGGPCQIDTFDPKPAAPREFTGPYTKVCPTNVDGIELSQTMPLTAAHADKYSVIRSMTHGDNSHEVSTYMMLTGVPPGGELVYPSMGSVIAYSRRSAPPGDVPAFISVMDPYSRFDESGFIGESGRSFAASGIISRGELDFKKAAQGSKKNQRPRRRPGDSAGEFSDRRGLLKAIDNICEEAAAELADADAMRQTAFSMLAGRGREAFDLTREPDSVREKYGSIRQFGQQLLLARRLVEAGASYVNVMLNGWDTHKKHFEAMETLMPALDAGYAALMEDLASRGLLDTTIVTLGGEFGRTPRIMYNAPWMGGRNHFGAAFSWLVAGGGFRGGCVVGKTNATGEKVVERPVYPWDLSMSVYELAGVSPDARLPHPTGCVAYAVPPEVRRRNSGGILREIMKS